MNNILSACLFVFGVILSPLLAATDIVATVSIDNGTAIGDVNRFILGNNVIGFNAKFNDKGRYANYGAGVWDAAKGLPEPEYVELAKQAGVSIIRWPGGNHSRTMDWKKAVGPVSDRPGQKFGLPEFLRFCDEVGAVPLIVIANQVGSKKDAADLVEYLNAPNDGSNPNGGEEWAAQRTRDGHPDPIGVRWFVLGNETFHTNMSATAYADKYLAYQAAMKAVDPQIKLGAVFEDSNNIDDGWTYTLFDKVGEKLDFGDFHPYFPKVHKQEAMHFSNRQMALAAVSADADLIYRLSRYRDLAQKMLGRSDFPLIATEYNGLFIQNEPLPFRQTLVNAVHNADFVRIMLQPQNNVTAANFWHLSNGYWGMITGYPHKKQFPVKQANYYVYELYNRYLGEELLEMKVDSPTFEFSGCCAVSPRLGGSTVGEITTIPRSELPDSWSRRPFMDGSQSQEDGVVTVNFDEGKDINYHHAKKVISVEPNTIYKVSVRVKTDRLVNGKVGIEVQDARGWKKTFSRSRNVSITGTTPWTWVTTEYRTLPAAKAIKVMARRYKGGGPIAGQAQFGEMRVEKIAQNPGAVESVVGVASQSQNGSRLYVILLNKDLDNEVKTLLRTPTGFRISEAEVLKGPSPYATNLDPDSSDRVGLYPMRIEKTAKDVTLRLPPSSVSGIRFERMQ